MPLPAFTPDGFLPPGLHATTLTETLRQFSLGSEARERQAELLRLVVEAAAHYETIKRVLVWGSFITAKAEPNDLDYSIVVSATYDSDVIAEEHRRFLIPSVARLHYGVDRNYLVLHDYPFDAYIEHLDFICRTRRKHLCGAVEISLRGVRGEIR